MRSTHLLRPTFILCACFLLASLASVAFADTQPAANDTEAPSAELASTELAVLVDDSVYQSIAGANGPAPVAASCTASLNCGDGNVISCSGNSSCFTQHFGNPDYVECDGQRTTCPNSCVATEICDCGGTLQCSSNVGNCSTGDDTVTCDGNTFNCPNFCQGGGF